METVSPETVSREVAQRLKDAGWVKNTAFKYVYIEEDERWDLVYAPGIDITQNRPEFKDQMLPAPTLDEVLKELSYEDFRTLYLKEHPWPKGWTTAGEMYNGKFAKWLHTTMRSSDAAAEVWIKTRMT